MSYWQMIVHDKYNHRRVVAKTKFKTKEQAEKRFQKVMSDRNRKGWDVSGITATPIYKK